MNIEPKNYKLSNEESEMIYETIRSFYFDHNRVLDNDKKAVYLGAQPGSGKTALGNHLIRAEGFILGVNAILLNTDDLRPYHPNYQELEKNPETNVKAPFLVNEDCSIWFKQLVKDAVKQNFNLIFDTTLGAKDISSFIKGMQTLKQDYGYKLQLEILAVKPELSRMGIHLRFESKFSKSGTGRFVSMDTHDLNFKMLLPNIKEGLNKVEFSKASVYSRNIGEMKGKLTNNSVKELVSILGPKGEGINRITDSILGERNRPLTAVENKYFQYRFDQVIDFIKIRNGNSEAFKNDIKSISQPNNVKLNFSSEGKNKLKM